MSKIEMKFCEKCGKYRVGELMLKDLSGCYVCKERKYKKENPNFKNYPDSYMEE